MARRATVIKAERAKAEHTLLLDAGDALLHDHHPAKRTRGQSSIWIMNKLGYDAMALGMLDISLLTLPELRQRIGEADFPVLSANAFVSGTQELLAEPYTVLEMDGHRIGILGLTEPGATAEVSVTDPLEAARTWLPRVKKQAEIVILLSHAGLESDQKIAQELPGIDVVVSGRNVTINEALVMPDTGTLILHADVSRAGNAGQAIGVAHLSFDALGRLLHHDWTKHILFSENYAADPEAEKWVDEAASIGL